MSLRAEFDSSLFFDTFSVPTGKSFLGNGTVTRPGLVACLNCLWLPACATSNQPSASSYIVNYADDLVICCRGRAEEALATMRVMMTKLTLTVNETKTRVSKLPEEKFDFLGYTFGRCYSTKTGRGPSKGPDRKREKPKTVPRRYLLGTSKFSHCASLRRRQPVSNRAYSRNCRTSTATPAEPGVLPVGIEARSQGDRDRSYS
jgi:hypothetical protein